MSPSSNQIKGIQELRFIGTFLIILCHISLFEGLVSYFDLNIEVPFYSAVELFFIISGFVAAPAFGSNDFNLKEFWIKKIWRIYPCLIAIVACAILADGLFYICLGSENAALFVQPARVMIYDAIKVLCGVYGIPLQGDTYMYGALWYMSGLIQFYFFGGIFSALLSHSKYRRSVLPVFEVFMCTSLYCFRIAIGCGWSGPFGGIFAVFYYIIGYKLDFIFYGLLLRRIYFLILESKIAPALKRLPNRVISTLSIILTLVIICFCGNRFTSPENNRVLCGIGLPIAAALFSIAVLSACFFNYDKANTKMLSVVEIVARRSYCIYICNFLGLELAWVPIHRYLSWTFYTGNPLHYACVQALLGIPCILIVAEVMYRYIEIPGSYIGKMRLRSIKERRPLLSILYDSFVKNE